MRKKEKKSLIIFEEIPVVLKNQVYYIDKIRY